MWFIWDVLILTTAHTLNKICDHSLNNKINKKHMVNVFAVGKQREIDGAPLY